MEDKEEDKEPVGRPKEDLSSLPIEWYDLALDIYNLGGSDVEVKAMIYRHRGSFSNGLWDRWMKEEEEFSKTIKMGRVLSEAWWQIEGRTSLNKSSFNYTGWYMNMKNRFNWKDKQDITSNDQEIKQITGINVK